MSIIDSIRLSGTTYQIQGSGGGGTQAIELTQAQYDALVDKDPNVFYIITDAEAGDLTNYYTKTETNTLLGGKADTATTYTKTEVDNAITAATSTKQDTLVSGTNIKTINNQSILGSGNIDIQGGGVNVVQTTGTSTTDVMSQNAVSTKLSGYVTTNTDQNITGVKTFVGEKRINFKQSTNSNKLGFTLYNSASTNNELASFEFRPNTFTIDGVQHPLMYFGHYRNSTTATVGVPQTVIGFRQYDQRNNAAYHYLMPLPEKAKTPFKLTTSFKDYYAPMGFKNGSTMITADNTGVVDLSSEFSGKVDTSTYNSYTAATDTALASKQTTLTAGTGISIVDNVISATGGGSITIDPSLDSGSTNAVANSAITEAVLVPSYRGLIEVQNNIAFPNATALYVENVTSGTYQDMAMIQFHLSGVSEVSENVMVTSFTGHTFNTEPSYVDYEWTEDNSIIFTPKTSGNYFYKIENVYDTGFGVYIIDNCSSGSSSSVIQNEIYPKINNLTEKVYGFKDTKVTGVSYNNLYNDYGGYWYHEIEILDNTGGRFAVSDNLRYDDFGYDSNGGIIFVKKTSGITSGSTDCLTSGGAYEALGGLKLVKLSQSEYDSLATKDNSTLYVIVN